MSSLLCPLDADTLITNLYRQNCELVTSQILSVLSSFTGSPTTPLSDELVSAVEEMTLFAGELSLEFGAQRSQIGVLCPPTGQEIVLSEAGQFVHCIDGEKGGSISRGESKENRVFMGAVFDLVVCPALFRAGGDAKRERGGGGEDEDKVDDTTLKNRRRTIFPGEALPFLWQ